MNEYFEYPRYLEEETAYSCRCSDCNEGAMIVRVTDTENHTEEFFSNCCFAGVDIAFTDYNWDGKA